MLYLQSVFKTGNFQPERWASACLSADRAEISHDLRRACSERDKSSGSKQKFSHGEVGEWLKPHVC